MGSIVYFIYSVFVLSIRSIILLIICKIVIFF